MSPSCLRIVLLSSPCLAVLLATSGCDRSEKADSTNRAVQDEGPGKADEPEPSDSGSQPGQVDAKSGPQTNLETAREALRKRRAEKPEEGKARGKSLMASVNEGRSLVKDKKYAEGVEKYAEALAIDPNHRPALGEMGWAEFNAGNYDSAHAHSLRALDLADTDKQRGMYLYNLGRIAEAREEIDEAIARYQVSVEKRPNDVVQKRLDDLLAKHEGPVTDATTGRGLEVLANVPTEPELCEAAAKHGYCGTDEECIIDSRPAGDPETFGLLFSGDSIFGCYHPVFKTDSGYALMEAVTLSQYGSEIVQGVNDVESKLQTTASGSYWVLGIEDVAEARGWSDDFDPEIMYFEAEKVVICHLDPAGPACTHPITSKFEGSFGKGEMSYTATITLDDDGILVDAVTASGVELDEPGDEVEGDGSLFLPEGRYAFASLAQRPTQLMKR